MESPSTTQSTTQVDAASDRKDGPRKRRRATVACRSCRQRKTKCDHIVPAQASDEMLRGMTKSAQVYDLNSFTVCRPVQRNTDLTLDISDRWNDVYATLKIFNEMQKNIITISKCNNSQHLLFRLYPLYHRPVSMRRRKCRQSSDLFGQPGGHPVTLSSSNLSIKTFFQQLQIYSLVVKLVNLSPS